MRIIKSQIFAVSAAAPKEGKKKLSNYPGNRLEIVAFIKGTLEKVMMIPT